MSSATLHEEDGSITVAWDFDGDYIVSVSVTSYGFAGHSDGHVDSTCFQRFCQSLGDLEKSRQGDAVLKSASPDLFEVHIASVDKLGHMAVKGTLRFDGSRNDTHRQLLKFEFEFDPSKLQSFAHAFDA